MIVYDRKMIFAHFNKKNKVMIQYFHNNMTIILGNKRLIIANKMTSVMNQYKVPLKTCYLSFDVKILLSRHSFNKKLNLNQLENAKITIFVTIYLRNKS